MKQSIIKMCAPVSRLSIKVVSVSLDCSVSLPSFPATSNPLSSIQIALEAPLLALHLPKFCTEAKMHVPQILTYAVMEKEMENKGKKGEQGMETW